MKILITGGSGFIGTHTCVALAQAGHELVILDNLCNSRADVIDRLATLCGIRPEFIEGDVRDAATLDLLFAKHQISAVMHFAGLKAVGESSEKPLNYYDNNVTGTLQLLAAMDRADIKTLVFSSSATVYGDPASVPIREDFPRSATNPYGRSKLIIEDILADLHQADNQWRIARLRYFNPVGAHESGLIGETPQGTPNNLMPYVAQVATGQREFLNVWGKDYPTPDGTGVRDYIHVCDLAEGHVAALDYLNRQGGMLTVNLGTGQGYSVLDMVNAFERASGHPVPYKIRPRRAGDSAKSWADPTLAKQLIGWQASRGLDQMCADAWRCQLISDQSLTLRSQDNVTKTASQRLDKTIMTQLPKNLNTVWHDATVTRVQREILNRHKGTVIWLTGLSGSGKSTLAYAVEDELYRLGCRAYVLDGDNIRHGLCGDLGFSAEDRHENIRRVGEVAKLFSDAGIIVLTAFISPYIADREHARKLIGSDFHEIYCRCNISICESRDTKGLYIKARSGQIDNFTGISSPYEEPLNAELTINSGEISVGVCVAKLMKYIIQVSNILHLNCKVN